MNSKHNYTKMVECFFDKFAKNFENKDFISTNLASSSEFKTFIEFLDMPVSSNLLDLGCGTGRYVLPLLYMGHKVTGIDISKKSLAVLMNLAKKFDLTENLKLMRYNLREPMFDSVFDATFTISTLHLLADTKEERKKIFFNMVSSVKFGGRVVVVQPNPFNPFFYPYLFFHPETSWEIEKNFIDYTSMNLISLFKEACLKNIKIMGYAMIPTRFVNTLPIIEKINKSLCRTPFFKQYSLFLLIRGDRLR